MVMSIGYNPFYKNTVRSAEVHVLHKFEKDFYGSEMKVLLMGFIRPEYDYDSLEGLVEDIKEDIVVSGASLGREGWGPKAVEGGYLWGEE
jgi:riboflavin kinase